MKRLDFVASNLALSAELTLLSPRSLPSLQNIAKEPGRKQLESVLSMGSGCPCGPGEEGGNISCSHPRWENTGDMVVPLAFPTLPVLCTESQM